MEHFPSKYLLILILTFAAILRLPGIVWGLPTFDQYANPIYYHPDEKKIIWGAQGFPEEIFTRTDLRYPTALHYFLGTVMLPFRSAKAEMPLLAYNDIYFLAGRLISLLQSLAACGLTYVLGKKLFNWQTGLVAAAFLAVTLYHVRGSMLATTDVATSFWLLVSLLLALRLERARGWLDFVALGASVGILVGVKYSGVFVAVGIGVLFIRYFLNARLPNERYRLIGGIALSVAVSLVVFGLTTPSAVLHPQALFSSVQYENYRVGEKLLPTWNMPVWQNFITVSMGAMGLPLVLLGLVGLVLSPRYAPKVLLPYSSLVIVYYLYFRSALLERYLITIMPVICILAAYWLVMMIASSRKAVVYAGWGLLIFTLSYGMYQDIVLAKLLVRDTRSQAAAYIIEEIPAGSTIALGDPTEPWRYPMIGSDHKLVTLDENPDYVVLSSFHGWINSDVKDYFLESGDELVKYKVAAEFQPAWKLNVEFVSPFLKIYQRNGK